MSFDGGGAGLTEVGIDDDDVVVGPAECDRALAKRVLAPSAPSEPAPAPTP